jgi:hypothetical protein
MARPALVRSAPGHFWGDCKNIILGSGTVCHIGSAIVAPRSNSMTEVERTSAGLRTVIPGCERRTLPKSTTHVDATGQGLLHFYKPSSLREQLARRADAPLRPRQGQMALPKSGLFFSGADCCVASIPTMGNRPNRPPWTPRLIGWFGDQTSTTRKFFGPAMVIGLHIVQTPAQRWTCGASMPVIFDHPHRVQSQSISLEPVTTDGSEQTSSPSLFTVHPESVPDPKTPAAQDVAVNDKKIPKISPAINLIMVAPISDR